MNKHFLTLAALAAVTTGASAAHDHHRTDFEEPNAGKKVLNVSGLDANNEHGGGSGGAPAVVEKAIPDGNGVDKATFVGTSEEGYHARNLAQAAALQQQQGQAT